MTVTTEVREVLANSNGIVRDWTFPFRFFTEGEVALSVLLPNGAAYVTVSPDLYRITPGEGTAEKGYEGGVVQYPISPATPLPAGYKVKVARTVPFTQTGVQLGQASGFSPHAIERELDRAAMRDQQIRDGEIEGVLRAPIGSDIQFLPQPETGKALGWLGKNLVNVDVQVEGEVFGIVGRDELEGVYTQPIVDALYVASYNTTKFGEGGGLYRARAAEPSHPGKIRSLDGRWWELDKPFADITAFGATEDNAYDALVGALAYSLTKGGTVPIKVPKGNWLVPFSITLTAPLIMEGTFTIPGGVRVRLRNQKGDFRTYLKMYDDGSGDWKRAVPLDPAHHTRALRGILEDLFADETLRIADGEGIRISINSRIDLNVDTGPTILKKPIRITNFIIDVASNFPLDDPVFPYPQPLGRADPRDRLC